MTKTKDNTIQGKISVQNWNLQYILEGLQMLFAFNHSQFKGTVLELHFAL
jgi:hypothetical protein